MTSNVIELKRKEPEERTYTVWKCWCGSTEFWLLQDGSIICPGCEEIQPHRRWFDPDEERE